MDKFVFTSDQLPPGLSNEQRFRAWLDLYNEHVGRTDLSPSAAPFDARTAFARIKDVVLVQGSATVAQVEIGASREASDEERIGLLVNAGNGIHSVHRGHDQFIPPGGSMLLSRMYPGRFQVRGNTTAWIIIDMPLTGIVKAARKAEDLIGTTLPAGNEALRMISSYAGLIFRQEGFADPRIQAHVSQTLLDLVGLAVGAEKDAAELARGRGLRAARLDAALQAIAGGYADPSFAIAVVARRLGLSERYIQDLLQTTGSGFAERVMELRLQQSASLLAHAEATRRKVSDVAFACDFNDLSYFHRCFRRRFGMTPAGARAG